MRVAGDELFSVYHGQILLPRAVVDLQYMIACRLAVASSRVHAGELHQRVVIVLQTEFRIGVIVCRGVTVFSAAAQRLEYWTRAAVLPSHHVGIAFGELVFFVLLLIEGVLADLTVPLQRLFVVFLLVTEAAYHVADASAHGAVRVVVQICGQNFGRVLVFQVE